MLLLLLLLLLLIMMMALFVLHKAKMVWQCSGCSLRFFGKGNLVVRFAREKQSTCMGCMVIGSIAAIGSIVETAACRSVVAAQCSQAFGDLMAAIVTTRITRTRAIERWRRMASGPFHAVPGLLLLLLLLLFFGCAAEIAELLPGIMDLLVTHYCIITIITPIVWSLFGSNNRRVGW
jgi:hypothetical protein